MTEHFERLWDMTRPAFKEQRTWERAGALAMSGLACLGRHTLTGMLVTSGQQFRDWSAAYRLFAEERIDLDGVWRPVIGTACGLLEADLPFLAVLDDTLVGKTGRRVAGAAWRRDPLGPSFSDNFIWAQRFLQIACTIPESGFGSRARAVPVDLCHCPTPKRPSKRATEEEWAQYKLEAAASRISVTASERIHSLRHSLDAEDIACQRLLVVSVDGAYTNSTVFRNIPQRTTIIGRIRKDAKLFLPPDASGGAVGAGRPRVYGRPFPTPEQMRQDDSIPWQQVKAYAAGEVRDFDVKVVAPLRWRGAGARDLRLIIIRPLGYRPSRTSRILYRDPAYVVCTDPALDVAQLLQAYLWRWEIEVAFRDQKTLMGLGEAQVRNETSVHKVPAFICAIYAYLHLAAIRAGVGFDSIPMPKWRKHQPGKRCTTSQMIALLRGELWARALRINLSDFVAHPPPLPKPQQIQNTLPSAVIYAHR